jgi:hypothetical protein
VTDHSLERSRPIGTDGDTRPFPNDTNLNPHLRLRTELSRSDTFLLAVFLVGLIRNASIRFPRAETGYPECAGRAAAEDLQKQVVTEEQLAGCHPAHAAYVYAQNSADRPCSTAHRSSKSRSWKRKNPKRFWNSRTFTHAKPRF